MRKPKDRRFIAGAAYGRGHVDEQWDEDFRTGGMHRRVFSGLTQKLAREIASELNAAYRYGRTDPRPEEPDENC